ncbi:MULTISPECIES: competence protein ComK [Thalassobacillus]|uniref:competence protein ComK n=1 Tax=Thalassobacillus TaxID=331971 RepID=UPI000A1CF024|nr:competence protein ComK [Thalassobacillus devorans]
MECAERALEYLINKKTMMVKPNLQEGKLAALILEDSHVVCAKMSVQNILNNSCILYGSSFNGRRDFARAFLHTDKKLPIEVSSPSGIVMFPLRDNITGEQVWFNYHHVKDQRESAPGKMEILFSDNTTYTIDTSKASFNRQFILAARLVNRLHHA